MPNWVSNTLTVSGERSRLDAFKSKAAERYVHGADGEEVEEVISFWNFVRPETEILHEYFGKERQDLSLEERLQYKTNHWYDWNIRNWGCKWDACEPDLDDEGNELMYRFQTPWGPPIEFYQSVVKQYPDLHFHISYLEEQGWGGEALGEDGEFSITEEWDIPQTHEDMVERTGDCYCWDEKIFDDCPAPRSDLVSA